MICSINLPHKLQLLSWTHTRLNVQMTENPHKAIAFFLGRTSYLETPRNSLQQPSPTPRPSTRLWLMSHMNYYGYKLYYQSLASSYINLLSSIMTILKLLTSRSTLFCPHKFNHIDIHHFVHNRIQTKALQIYFMSNKDKLVDILTKSLSTSRLSILQLSLSIVPTKLDSQEDINNTETAKQNKPP